jgi:transcriptional regulator with XRE-family HTH domain
MRPSKRKQRSKKSMHTLLVGLGDNIRRLRKSRKYSQERLAELAGLHWSYIGRIERGKQNVSVLNLAKLARGLDVPLARLFRGLKY